MRVTPFGSVIGKSGLTSCLVVTLITAAGMFDHFLQQFAITSDQLTMISLAEDFFRNHSFNAHLWLFPRAPLFFPDFALELLLKSVVRGDVNDAWIMQCYQLAVTTALACLILWQISSARSAIQIYGALIVFAFITAHYALIDEGFVYPFVSFSHASALVLALIGGVLFSRGRYVNFRSPIDLAISVLLTVFGMVSDKSFIALFSMPVIVVASFEAVLARRMAVFPIVITQFVGLCCMLIVDRSLPFQVLPLFDVTQVAHHFTNSILAIWSLPLAFRIVAVLALLNLLAFTIVTCTKAAQRREMDGTLRLQCFIVASVTFNIILCSILWAEPVLTYARYAVMLQFSLPMLLAVSLSFLFRRLNCVWLGSVVLYAAAAALMFMSQNWDSSFKMIGEQNANATHLGQCVRLHGLHSGLAQYWLARKLSSSTNWVVQIDQLEPAYPRAFFWGSDVLWFFRKLDGISKADHDFVIVDGFGSDVLEKQLGIPTRYVDCNGWRFALYDEQILEHHMTMQLELNGAIARTQAYLPKPVLRVIDDNAISFGLADLSMRIGQQTPDGASVSPVSGGGYFLYGPYVTLPPGSYSVAFSFTCTGSLDGTLFDVSADAGKRTIATWPFSAHPNLCDGTQQSAMMNFQLPQSASLVETHAIYGGIGDLTVRSVVVSRSEASTDPREN